VTDIVQVDRSSLTFLRVGGTVQGIGRRMSATLDSPVFLDSAACRDPQLVGPKAASLSALLHGGLPVPPGFVLPLRKRHPLEPAQRSLVLDAEVIEAFTRTLASSTTSSVIVRSSAAVEGAGNFAFPGMFLTVPNVRSSDALWHAINRILASSTAPSVRQYAALHKLNPHDYAMNILVQAQMRARIGGAARLRRKPGAAEVLALVEIAERHPAKLLRGEAVDVATEITVADGHIIAMTERLRAGNPAMLRALMSLARIAANILNVIGEDVLIEWVADDEDLWLVQSRGLTSGQNMLPQSRDRITPSYGEELLPHEREIGLKGAAMLLFASLGWFTRPLYYAYPGTLFSQIEADLAHFEPGDAGVTIRYSYRNEIGLPRLFSKSVAEAAELIRGTRHDEWFLIVHGYIGVADSFELYIDDHKLVLEHVPGVWESDNRQTPDVVIMHGDRVETLRSLGPRTAKYHSPDGTRFAEVSPLAEITLRQWAGIVQNTGELLRTSLFCSQPVICHFVADQDGTWQFLNVRRTPALGEQYAKKGAYHAVTRPSDMDSWDGNSPILLQFSVERGEERSVAEIARWLPRDEPVYVAFGLLSHPAMVLRELGINVVPAYLSHEISGVHT